MYCSNCGTPTHTDDKYCVKCGHLLVVPAADTPSDAKKCLAERRSKTSVPCQETQEPKNPSSTSLSELKWARAWPRYWSRNFDLLLTGIPASIVVISFVYRTFGARSPLGHFLSGSHTLHYFHYWRLWVVSLPIALVLDAVIYAIFHNTPGRWMAGIRITDAAGNSLSFTSYLARNFRLYIPGLAAGIPFLVFVTFLFSYDKASRGQLLSWDRGHSSRPIQIKSGAWRTYLTAIVFILATISLDVYGTLGASTQSPTQFLTAAVAAVNKTAPRMVGSETRLDGATERPGLTLQYDYTILNVSALTADPAIVTHYFHGFMRTRLQKLVCTSPNMKKFREIGATINYHYVDENGLPLSTVTIPTKSCSGPPE